MRKVIAAMNMTIDGFCDHTAGIADDELHEHYEELIRDAGILLYGRITYQLMEYWRTVLEHPEGNKSEYDFAVTMDKIPKLVFSHTLKSTDWNTASLATGSLEEEVEKLKKQEGKDILVGSPSLIVALTKLGLIDEYQLCVHPVVEGKGLPLFKNITERTVLKLIKTKIFKSGAITLYYQAPNK
ncbi:MAG: dihydrofolate reductase [Cytophagaceae bacterium]|jgi:dihydrofolate reductase|nr:dihydrofolate reductase [Cytophagaceae bacterium]